MDAFAFFFYFIPVLIGALGILRQLITEDRAPRTFKSVARRVGLWIGFVACVLSLLLFPLAAGDDDDSSPPPHPYRSLHI